MRTIQLQCGSCRKMMAISVEHLGKQVRCPHCKSVVQTPPAEPQPEPAAVAASEEPDIDSPRGPAPAPPASNWIETPSREPETDASDSPPERESIFEDRKRDDLFDEETPKVEMPREEAEDLQESGVGIGAPSLKDGDEANDDFRAMRTRAAPKASNFSAYLLIFLIPYAICCTGFIAYLLLNQQRDPVDRLQYLADPYTEPNGKPDKGKTKRISQPPHDSPVPKNTQARLGDTRQIGDVEVTPLRVLARKIGDETDLILEVRAKNLSKDTQFCPISRNFLYHPKTNSLSYVYLEEVGQENKFFSGSVDHNFKDPSAILKPGESGIFEIRTDIDFRSAAAKFLESGAELQWRIQVRRGFVKFRDRDVSATAVVGVQFTPKEIQAKVE